MKIVEKLKSINAFIINNILLFFIFFLLLNLYLNKSTIEKQNNNIENNVVNAPYLRKSSPMLMSTGIAPNAQNNSKIVKNFSLTIETENAEDVKNIVEKKLTTTGAIIDSFYSYNYIENELAYNFVIKVPTEKVELTINFLKTLGTLKNESSSINDITEEYQDTKSRLQNLYLRRDNLRKLLDTKTDKLSDIIAVDRELNNVQYEIERLERDNRNIDDNITYSKLELTILPRISIIGFNNYNWQISKSWENSINSLILFTQKSIDVSFKLLVFMPIIIFLAILIILVKVIIIRKKRNMK